MPEMLRRKTRFRALEMGVEVREIFEGGEGLVSGSTSAGMEAVVLRGC